MNQISTYTPPPDGHQGPPSLLTVAEFRDRFAQRIGINTLYQLVRDGRIHAIRLGERKILIPASEINDWPNRELERTTS